MALFKRQRTVASGSTAYPPSRMRGIKPTFPKLSPATPPSEQQQEGKSGDPNEPPASWPGTRSEWGVYSSLVRQGRQPDRDFLYTPSNALGGVGYTGNTSNFLSFREGIAINIHGVYDNAIQATQEAEMTALGYTVIGIDEGEVASNVDYYVEEALLGHDHSQH